MPVQKGDNQETKGSFDIFGKKLDVFGVPEERPVKRSAGEVAELKRKIGLIARVFSKTYDLGVYPSPQGGWCCSIDEQHMEEIDRYLHGEVQTLDALPTDALKPKKIFYDVSDVEEKMTDDEVIGVTRHEIGHVNHSDFRLLLEGQRQAMDEGYLATSWASISNALEDPRVNNLEIAGSDVVRGYLFAYEGKMTECDDELYIENHPFYGKPVIYISDLASDKSNPFIGGRLVKIFFEEYKKNYLDKGIDMPIYFDAREATSYQLLMNQLKTIEKWLGVEFAVDELGSYEKGKDTMRAVVLIPHKRVDKAA